MSGAVGPDGWPLGEKRYHCANCDFAIDGKPCEKHGILQEDGTVKPFNNSKETTGAKQP